MFGLLQHGLVEPVPAEDSLAQPLALFDDAGVSQRTVSVAELEQAAELLRRQNPSNLHQRQLAAELLAAHAEQRLQFRWSSGMLAVISWSTQGEVHHVNPISG